MCVVVHLRVGSPPFRVPFSSPSVAAFAAAGAALSPSLHSASRWILGCMPPSSTRLDWLDGAAGRQRMHVEHQSRPATRLQWGPEDTERLSGTSGAAPLPSRHSASCKRRRTAVRMRSANSLLHNRGTASARRSASNSNDPRRGTGELAVRSAIRQQASSWLSRVHEVASNLLAQPLDSTRLGWPHAARRHLAHIEMIRATGIVGRSDTQHRAVRVGQLQQ